MPRLAIYLLGPLRVELGGEELHIPRRKVLALLAYLSAERHAHRRDSLAALLWPEYDQSSARADLRRTLSLLNRSLGAGWLVADRESVGLHPDVVVAEHEHGEPVEPAAQVLWLDVEQFRQRLSACQAHAHPPNELCEACVPLLEEAAELYRGDFMSGFALRDSLAFDEWQFFQTDRLKDQLASALERLVRWHAGREEYDRALGHARRRLEHDTLNEAAHFQLMELCALAGQQTAALRQYELCKQMLNEELGVSPSAEITALYERIRAGEDIGREPETAIPHNLPPQSTPFIGRETELAELRELVVNPETRLVTILGPGGIGKSRLALAVAERLLDAALEGGATPIVTDGVFFAPLARLSDADQIVPSIAEALYFRLGGGEQDTRTPRQQVLDYLREKRLLLILDNFEHLLEGVDLVTDILRTAPAVQLLVTSRERLNLREEHACAIQGLAYPDDVLAKDWEEYAAVKLFLDTARRVQTSFELCADDAVSLIRICRMLDGMPLGIELAAGWVDVLSLTDIAAEIERGLDLLETEWYDIPARHRSMRAVFDTSWRYLGDRDRDILEQLCMFRGGFTRDAAREVAGVDLHTLARLVDKSLLQFNRAQERYEIHELLRQYGSDKLAMDPEREAAVHERHSAHFCAALEPWAADPYGSRQLEASKAIRAELENIRVAWEWAAARGHVTRLDQAMDGLCHFLESHNRFRESETLCHLACDALDLGQATMSSEAQRILAKGLLWRSRFNANMGNWELAKQLLQESQALLDSPALADWDTREERVNLHYMLGWAAEPHWEEARRHCEKWLALARELGQRLVSAHALLRLGWVEYRVGRDDLARQHYQESLQLCRDLGHHSEMVLALMNLGSVARVSGDYVDAQRIYDEGLALARAHGDTWGAALALVNSAWLNAFLGDFEAAADYQRESAALWRALGDRIGLARTLAHLGLLHWFSGEIDQAYRLIEECLAIAEDMQVADECGWALVIHAWLDAITGQYDEARTYAERYLAHSSAGPPVGFYVAIAQGALGWTALAKHRYAEARQPSCEAIAALHETRLAMSREYTAWALAALGRAEYGAGNRAKAQQHLFEALEIVVEIRAFIPLLHLMPIIPVVLADEDDPRVKARAVELYALATSHPFVAKAQLFEDIAGRYIRAATASLPPDVVAAAQERGRALDWWETAEALLDELKGHGWSR